MKRRFSKLNKIKVNKTVEDKMAKIPVKDLGEVKSKSDEGASASRKSQR